MKMRLSAWGSLIVGAATLCLTWIIYKMNRNLKRAQLDVKRIGGTEYLLTNIGKGTMFNIEFYFGENEIGRAFYSLEAHEYMKLKIEGSLEMANYGLKSDIKEITIKYHNLLSKKRQEYKFLIEQEYYKDKITIPKVVKEEVSFILLP